MPSVSPAQHRFMEATAHGQTDAPVAVGREFVAADAAGGGRPHKKTRRGKRGGKNRHRHHEQSHEQPAQQPTPQSQPLATVGPAAVASDGGPKVASLRARLAAIRATTRTPHA